MRINIYVDNSVYVDTIDVEENMSSDEIDELAMDVAQDWLMNNHLYWEPDDE